MAKKDDKEKGVNWNCPYCGAHQAVVDARFDTDAIDVDNDESAFGKTSLSFVSVVCANEKCKQMTLKVLLRRREDRFDGLGNYTMKLGETIQEWSLLPESSAKPQPEYIPEAIRNDYLEACRIKNLSAKASATLSRRCLQGMIRDFCGIAKARLIDEIRELRERTNQGKAPLGVQPDSVDAIDHVRGIGNIGAHMEADINVIIDIDPNEAQVLIDLLELLFEEWYVSRYVRAERLQAIGAIAADKKAAKSKA